LAWRILTFNCHESYVYHLARLGYPLDVVAGLPVRHVPAWDTSVRPVPENATLIRANEIEQRGPYRVALCHSLSDLIAIKHVEVPRVLILHRSLLSRAVEEGCSLSLKDMQCTLRNYLCMVGGVAVAASRPKLLSWGVEGIVIEPPVDSDDCDGYTSPAALQCFPFATFLERWHEVIREAQLRQQRSYRTSRAWAN
jgi:hypothetical protein